jgi:hypothetical protein
MTGYGFITAIIGLILGISGKKKAMEAGAPTGMAQAGIVMCIIALAISVLVTIACIACLASFDIWSSEFWDFYLY